MCPLNVRPLNVEDQTMKYLPLTLLVLCCLTGCVETIKLYEYMAQPTVKPTLSR
jgi:hypothetical protein